MHLATLEKTGFVTGQFELTDDGKALEYFEPAPFSKTIDLATLPAAVTEKTLTDTP